MLDAGGAGPAAPAGGAGRRARAQAGGGPHRRRAPLGVRRRGRRGHRARRRSTSSPRRCSTARSPATCRRACSRSSRRCTRATPPSWRRSLAHPALLSQTVAAVAALASEAVAELVATNEQRLLAYPEIIEKLYMNKATRMSTADRVLELAVRNKIELKGIPAYKEAAIAIGERARRRADPAEPTPDDVLFDETEAVAQQATGRRRRSRTPTGSTRRRATRSSTTGSCRSTRASATMTISQKIRARDARERGRAAASRARLEPARRGRGDQEPEHPGERGRAHQRAAATSPTTCCASSRWTASGRGRTRSS